MKWDIKYTIFHLYPYILTMGHAYSLLHKGYHSNLFKKVKNGILLWDIEKVRLDCEYGTKGVQNQETKRGRQPQNSQRSGNSELIIKKFIIWRNRWH